MNELHLKYTDADGAEQRVAVDGDRFSIGRHSESGLPIADARLSREHLVIERDGEAFYAEDLGSSNGTDVNGEPLFERRRIENGDKLSLGGFEIEAEIVGAATDATPESEPIAAALPTPAAAATPPANKVPASPGGIPKYFFFLAPALGLGVLLLVVGILVLMGGRNQPPPEPNYVNFDDPTPRPRKTDEIPTSSPTNVVVGTPGPSNGVNIEVPTPATNLSDTAKIEQDAANFLRKAAQNDPRAFVTGEQAAIISAKAKSMGGAMGDNLASARRNAAAIKSLAQSKNLKPELVAAAALAKLGSSRGDVLSTAQSMIGVLDRLSIQVGNEFGDDCLLMLAAYDQGAAGDFMGMRNMLQDVATKSNAPVREIRSIWFLKKQGKISDSQYDLALRFLAAGTTMQNPRDLGVNAEAVTF